MQSILCSVEGRITWLIAHYPSDSCLGRLSFLRIMGLGCIYWEELIFFRELYRSLLMKSGYYLGIDRAYPVSSQAMQLIPQWAVFPQTNVRMADVRLAEMRPHTTFRPETPPWAIIGRQPDKHGLNKGRVIDESVLIVREQSCTGGAKQVSYSAIDAATVITHLMPWPARHWPDYATKTNGLIMSKRWFKE